MLRVSKQGDVAAEKDAHSNSLDFGRGLVQLGPNVQREHSGPLWGPGATVQETPASIFSRNLQIWRTDNAQSPAAKAAEELDKLYASMPEEVFDLTFQDMIDRKISGKQRSPGKEAGAVKNDSFSPKKSTAVTETVEKNSGKVKHASKENKNSGSSYSIPAKLSRMLSPKAAFSSSRRSQLTQEQLDELVDKKSKKSSGSKRDGLYSASTTPTASFRRVSPLASPRLSPRASFSEYMLQIDGHSFDRELARSARYLELHLEESSAGVPSVDYLSPRNHSRAPSLSTLASQANDCSNCSATNLFLKSNCLVCGKTYCLRCMTLETEETPVGRKCKNNCVKRPVKDGSHEDGEKFSKMGCWPFRMCVRFKRAKRSQHGAEQRRAHGS